MAQRAHVGKTTIYRGWPNRASLVIDAFYEGTQQDLGFPETGSAREDFRLQIEQVAALLRGPAGAAFAALVAGARNDAKLASTLAERWVVPRRQWGLARMKRAIQDGDCAPDLNVLAALSALYSPVYAPLFLGLGVPEADELSAVLDLVLPGIFCPPTAV